jgi:hypothetical protein
MMQKLLEEGGYQNIEQFHNEEDIESIVKLVIEKQQALFDRFHFHYSGFGNLFNILGHGTRNATVQIDKHNFTRKLTDEGFESICQSCKSRLNDW